MYAKSLGMRRVLADLVEESVRSLSEEGLRDEWIIRGSWTFLANTDNRFTQFSLNCVWKLHASCSASHPPQYTQEEGRKSRYSAKVSGDTEAILAASPRGSVWRTPSSERMNLTLLAWDWLTHLRGRFLPNRKKIHVRAQCSSPLLAYLPLWWCGLWKASWF